MKKYYDVNAEKKYWLWYLVAIAMIHIDLFVSKAANVCRLARDRYLGEEK